jgi:hypothetical protein
MPALATVRVALYEDNDAGMGTMTLQNIAVGYTPNAGPVSSTTTADVFPLLLPQATG